MTPVIRVDEEVWAWLKSQAQPFQDTPNSVLRRVAGIDPPSVAEDDGALPTLRRVSARRRGRKTPQHEYRSPILRILQQHGGRLERTGVLRELEATMGSRLTSFDREDIKSGTVRWQKSAEWEVSTMRQEGLLLRQSQSPRGVWCLSPAGSVAATELMKPRRADA